MVHALNEVRRTLKPNGILIDLRPVEGNSLVEVASRQEIQIAGKLIDMPVGQEDDEAAFRAMREAEAKGWFIKEREDIFDLFYYWDTPSEMKEFIDTEWADFEKMEDDIYRAAQSLWTSANADARVRVRRKMLITRWGKSA